MVWFFIMKHSKQSKNLICTLMKMVLALLPPQNCSEVQLCLLGCVMVYRGN